MSVPKFTQIARSYLLHIGSLDWTQINPDIFGSMIQAVADDEERGALGMHYTSVPNILKVLNPLFQDDLHAQLKEADKNPRKLLNLRKRLARIRVFDPACGSGNFLVIAYKQMRAIEAEINILRGEPQRASEIPLTNFRGIEIRHFAVEIARLALIIAEYQCDELYRGKRLALAEFLPLSQDNWITHGNALRIDWLKVCPPTGTAVKLVEDDLFQTPLDQPEFDFENEGGETYICGNPPYVGDKKQDRLQKDDLSSIFSSVSSRWRSFDYVAGWFYKATLYGAHTKCSAAFVATNSISQGQQVPLLWPLLLKNGFVISFAHTSFKWANLATHNAGVIVVIVGLSQTDFETRKLYSTSEASDSEVRSIPNINPYLAPAPNVFVASLAKPVSDIPEMLLGNFAKDDGNLFCDAESARNVDTIAKRFIRPAYGAKEFIQGIQRYCFWITLEHYASSTESALLNERFARVAQSRARSTKAATAQWSAKPYRFVEVRLPEFQSAVIVPRVSSETRDYLAVGLLPARSVITEAFGMYDVPRWTISLLSSRLHVAWIGTVCGRMKTDYRYSNTLGWNTFPVPSLTDDDKSNLTRCAENILLTREAHWPATIAELYDPDNMPDDLRAAHDRNDETLERIYIGRRFKNDTERLETLFKMYSEMTVTKAPLPQPLSPKRGEGSKNQDVQPLSRKRGEGSKRGGKK